jgi:ferredoxin-NADP reductase/hemoglobin-like flavoprotein
VSDHVELVQESFERARRRADHVVRYFYAHLFSHSPEVRPLFPEDMKEQFDRLFGALGHVVSHLDNPDLPNFLGRLGRDHRKFGITPEHYQAVGRSLIAAIRFGSGSAWSHATEAAWSAAYEAAANAMLQGAEDSEAQFEPASWNASVVGHRLHEGHTAVIKVLTSDPYPYRAGQYATVHSPQLPGVWRPYSLASSPTPGAPLEFHVSRAKGGLLSSVLCDRTITGDRLQLGAASGTVTLGEIPEGQGVTLIAAGSGWAQIKSLLESLERREPRPRTRVYFAARSRRHFYDIEAMTAFADIWPDLETSWWCPERGEAEGQADQRLRAALAARSDWNTHHVRLSGPTPFIESIRELLIELGALPSRIRHDPLAPKPSQRKQHTSPAEHFLSPRPVPWIDPAQRISLEAAADAEDQDEPEDTAGLEDSAGATDPPDPAPRP